MEKQLAKIRTIDKVWIVLGLALIFALLASSMGIFSALVVFILFGILIKFGGVL